MRGTAPDQGLGKGTENTTQFYPIRHVPEASLGKRYWRDNTHHEIGDSLILVRAQRGGNKIVSNYARSPFGWAGL